MSTALLYAIAYYVIVFLGTQLYLRGKVKNIEDFAGTNALGWVPVALGLTLIPLGSGHTMSLWEASAGLGFSVLWWPVIVGGIFLPIMMLWLGPWLRRMKVETFPEGLELLFGKNMRYLQGCTNVFTWTGIAMSETLATGAAIYGLTGGSIAYNPWCILIAFLLILAYVIFGGVLQYSFVSTVNAIVMIIGSYLALFLVGGWITAHALGWHGVIDFYQSTGQMWKFNPFKMSGPLVFQIIIPIFVLHVSAAAVNQGTYIPMLAARTDADCRKGVFAAAGINGISSFPWVCMGIIAMSLPAIAKIGPKLSVIELAIRTMPPIIVGLLMVCLLAATLSTGASVMIGNSTIIVNDVLKRAMFPQMKDETRMKLMRPMIIICGILACVPAFFAPVIFPIFLWCFSFGIPIFVVYFIGMTWKRNVTAAWITVIVAFAINMIWTFALPSWVPPGPWQATVYPVVVSSLVLGIILNAIMPGEPGYLRVLKQKKFNALAAE
nr:hypothetical protein [uncultured Holophaga sp.]